MMIIVSLDGAARIPECKAERSFVEKLAAGLDALAPGHQRLAGDAQIAELHLVLLAVGLRVGGRLAALIAAEYHAVDGLVDGNYRRCEIWIAVHRTNDAACGANHQTGWPIHALNPSWQGLVYGRRHCKKRGH